MLIKIDWDRIINLDFVKQILLVYKPMTPITQRQRVIIVFYIDNEIYEHTCKDEKDAEVKFKYIMDSKNRGIGSISLV